MISVTKLRAGTCFEEGNLPFKVVEYKHTHLSRGGGTIKVKVRNLSDGRLLSKTYKSGEKVEEIDVNKKNFQYLYKDGDSWVFMDPVSFEQLEVADRVIGESGRYLKEGEEVALRMWEEKVLDVDLPPKMEFEVAEAAPGEKGDSASNVYKEAMLKNGLRVKVPLFVNQGDMVRVDTRTGEYVERVG